MLISACGEDNYVVKYAWGKTFTYQGAYTNNLATSNNGGSEIGKLLKAEYDHMDLTKVNIGGDTEDISSMKGSSYEEFIATISEHCNETFTRMYKDITIKVGTQEENNITINDKTYSIQNGASPDFFEILAENEEDGKLGHFGSRLINTPNSTDNKYLFDISITGEVASKIYGISIIIPLDHAIQDPNAMDNLDGEGTKIGSSIMISFTPYFCEAK